jgi:hypothetical protein
MYFHSKSIKNKNFDTIFTNIIKFKIDSLLKKVKFILFWYEGNTEHVLLDFFSFSTEKGSAYKDLT